MADHMKEIEQYEDAEIIIEPQEMVRWQNKAEHYVDNPKKTKDLLSEALEKANNNKNRDVIQNIWDKIQLLFSLLKDWLNGDYKTISKTAIISVIAGLIYFVSPVDFVPDWIVSLGLVDDVAVLGLIFNQLDKELTRYKKWKNSKF
jgi:uncharacterized membrane protein YkvA (DUF1232 family)